MGVNILIKVAWSWKTATSNSFKSLTPLPFKSPIKAWVPCPGCTSINENSFLTSKPDPTSYYVLEVIAFFKNLETYSILAKIFSSGVKSESVLDNIWGLITGGFSL